MDESRQLTIVEDVIRRAIKRGADAADAICIESTELSATVRLGALETIERAENTGIGLRVMIGKRQACVSSSDFSNNALDTMIAHAVDMANIAPEDPYLRIAEKEQLCHDTHDLELYDDSEPSAETLIEQANLCEDTARNVSGITNSEGASASYYRNHVALATSNDFARAFKTSSSSLSLSVLAGETDKMERDYAYSVARFASDVDAPEALGNEAASRTLARLNPHKISTCQVPIIFDPRVGRELLNSFISAINGVSIAKGTSFLAKKLGEQLFPTSLQIIDDPLRKRGLSSRLFDSEGITCSKKALVKDGILQHWLLDLRSAAQLDMETTANASRGLATPPSPSPNNVYIEPGTLSPNALMEDIESGLYVTNTFGMGINLVTGDYSQGASGIWIEKGEKAYPVSEITIAGKLSDMFSSLIVANDLEFRYGVNVPTLRVEGMTVAGS